MKYKSLMLAAALALPLSAHASGSPVPSVLFFPLVVIGAIAAQYSFQMAIALLAAIYVLDALATVFLVPELKGKTLD